MKLIEKILVFIITIYIVILPFVTNVFTAHEVLTISAVILLLCVCILCVLYSGRSISVTLIDVAAFSFIIYEWINIGIIRNFQMDGLVYFEGIALGMIYLITKLTGKCYLILLLLAIALSGGIQGLVGILQYFDVLASGHTEFKITGSFNNPGPFGGYLSISFIAAICLLFLKKDKKWRVGSFVLFLLIGSMLICSNSRAAWLAVLMTLLYVFCKTGLVAVRNVLKKRMIYSFIVILCIAIVAGLYQYKKSSADVRLLIWTVSVSMFTDAFLCGHGIGSFPMKYIEYQADYFESHPDSEFVVLSDNNTQAFNEFIAIACEQGVLGLIFVLLIVCMAFMTKGCDLIQYLLLSLCIFSSFSYPGDVFSLKIYFPLFIGLVSGSSAVCLSVRRTVIVPCCITFFLGVFFSSIYVRRYYEAGYAQLHKDDQQIVLLHNKEYMARYLKLLLDREEYEKFIHSATAVSFPFMTSVLKCDIGMVYMQLGRMEEAEETLESAYWMVPSKILPKYLLFILYRDTNQYSEARRMAEEIISQKVFQVGSVYLEARSEAKHFLKI